MTSDQTGKPGSSGDSIVDGRTWEAFAVAIRDAGKVVLAEHAPSSAMDRAEGFRYLTRLTNAALAMFVEFSDPYYPEIGRFLDTSIKWGLDNVDALYGKCSVRPNLTYRIRGYGGSAHFLAFYAQSGSFGDDTPEGKAAPGGVGSVLSNLDIETGPDGSFEIVASRDPQPGNWLRLEPTTSAIGVRQFFYDWENEHPWKLSIERSGADEPPPPLTAEASTRVGALRRPSTGTTWRARMSS